MKTAPVDPEDLRKVWEASQRTPTGVGICVSDLVSKDADIHALLARLAMLKEAIGRGEVDAERIDFRQAASE